MNNSRAPRGRYSEETTPRGFSRGTHAASIRRQNSQPPNTNQSHGVSLYGRTDFDVGFPPLPSALQQTGPAQRISYQNDPVRDITEALAPLASMLYAQLSRRMD